MVDQPQHGKTSPSHSSQDHPNEFKVALRQQIGAYSHIQTMITTSIRHGEENGLAAARAAGVTEVQAKAVIDAALHDLREGAKAWGGIQGALEGLVR